MSETIVLSLKPKFAPLIESGKKNYEYRKYRPKRLPKRIVFYISSPVSSVLYIAETGEPVVYPERVKKMGYGNKDFNNGLKKSKYAFPIKHLYKLKSPLDLSVLRNKYSFHPPQSFAYLEKYEKLRTYLNKAKKEEIF